MTQILPKALTQLIEELGKLPGVGPRTAERYAYYLLRRDARIAKKLAEELSTLHERVTSCPITFALIDAEEKVSPLYADPKRDKKIVAVVAEPYDILAIEKTGSFKGTYHVLGGLISPIDGIGVDELTIPQLVARVENDTVQEVIMATNASVEGETTVLYIQQQLEGKNVTITRLARGLPIGVDLEYADHMTLSRALEGRQQLSHT